VSCAPHWSIASGLLRAPERRRIYKLESIKPRLNVTAKIVAFDHTHN
jgi:hypothetical protein